MLNHDELCAEAGRALARWQANLMRQLDPRSLTHCMLVSFAQRPFYFELHCWGKVVGSFEWKVR